MLIDMIGEALKAGNSVNAWASDSSAATVGYCKYCRDGDLVNCTNQGYTGVQHDGGYAEVMIAKAKRL